MLGNIIIHGLLYDRVLATKRRFLCQLEVELVINKNEPVP